MLTNSPTTIDAYPKPLDLDLNVYYHGSEKCSPGRKYGPMVRDHYVMQLVDGGKGTYETKNGCWTLGEGQGFLIRPGARVCYWADTVEPWSYRWVGFNGSRVETVAMGAGLPPEVSVFSAGELAEEITACFEVLERAGALPKTSKMFMETSALYGIFSALARMAPSPQRESRLERHIRHAMDFIERNHSREMTMDEMAKHVGLDRSHLAHIFKRTMNISPTDYLIGLRIQKASELLTSRPDLSIKEVAFSVGYRDPFFFSKTFRRLKGMTPSEFRANGLKL